jgi:hypothetical protein
MAIPKIKKIAQLPSAVQIAGDDYWIIDQNNVTKKVTTDQFLQKIKSVVGNVELRKTDTYIQWRHVGDLVWQDLIAIADISGDGNSFTVDADTIHIRINNGYFQWQYNSGTWYNLISVTDFKATVIPQISFFTGNDTSKVFGPVPGLSSNDPNKCLVVVGGVVQQPTVSYTLSMLDGGKLVFDQAPPIVPISIQPY